MTNSALALKASASSDSSVKRSHKAMLNFKGVKKVQANNVPREELEYLWNNTSDNHPKPIHLDMIGTTSTPGVGYSVEERNNQLEYKF